MFTGELLYLAKTPSELQPEAVVQLQKELLSRNLTKETLALSNHLARLASSEVITENIQSEINSITGLLPGAAYPVCCC